MIQYNHLWRYEALHSGALGGNGAPTAHTSKIWQGSLFSKEKVAPPELFLWEGSKVGIKMVSYIKKSQGEAPLHPPLLSYISYHGR